MTRPLPLGLTPRQLEVLRLVASGLTNQQIGKKLRIGEKTVELHRAGCYRRLRVNNTVQAIRAAMALNLLPKNLMAV